MVINLIVRTDFKTIAIAILKLKKNVLVHSKCTQRIFIEFSYIFELIEQVEEDR